MFYSYDGAGNRLTEVWKDAQNLTVESFNYAYNTGNYLVSRGSEIFETGLYGQMTSRTEAGVATTYAYNPMRMMKEASEAGVTLAKYEYDALGRRIISWLDDEWRTVSLWSGNDSIYEIRQEWTTPPPNPPTETITRYVAVNGQYLAKLVGGPIAMQPFFHHTDIVGTVRAVTDSSGVVVARYAYEPFGSLTTASELVDGELHRFTGKSSDLETDLSYFNARYYDPAIGRFTSSDPAKDGLNWYQYCNGNPIVSIDQNGKQYTNYSEAGMSIGMVAGALIGGARAARESYDTTGHVNLGKALLGAVDGAARFGMLGYSLGTLIDATIAAADAYEFVRSWDKWGVTKDGVHQGDKHFFDYNLWAKGRIGDIADELGEKPFTFDEAGFIRFTQCAERVKSIGVRKILENDRIAYFSGRIVVITMNGLLQTMFYNGGNIGNYMSNIK